MYKQCVRRRRRWTYVGPSPRFTLNFPETTADGLVPFNLHFNGCVCSERIFAFVRSRVKITGFNQSSFYTQRVFPNVSNMSLYLYYEMNSRSRHRRYFVLLRFYAKLYDFGIMHLLKYLCFKSILFWKLFESRPHK